jgi:hypothetical protein
MIQTLAIANYRSLRNVPLGSLNVVSGENGSGKSVAPSLGNRALGPTLRVGCFSRSAGG